VTFYSQVVAGFGPGAVYFAYLWFRFHPDPKVISDSLQDLCHPGKGIRIMRKVGQTKISTGHERGQIPGVPQEVAQ
jgi:hypothetical protein